MCEGSQILSLSSITGTRTTLTKNKRYKEKSDLFSLYTPINVR